MNLKLGRLPAKFTRASFMRSHVMARHLEKLGPAPASSPDWVSAVTDRYSWGMDANNQYGDCVIASTAHQEMLRTANVGNIFIPTDLQVLQLYGYFQGYAGPDNEADIRDYLANNDGGCNELDVIHYGWEQGYWGHKLNGSANLDPSQMDQLKWAVCLFGACRLGVNLPQSAMDQFYAGEPWDVAGDAGPVGGHDVPVVGYYLPNATSPILSPGGPPKLVDTVYRVVTWGKVIDVTQAFMAAQYPDSTPYVEEAHCELSSEFFNSHGMSPSKLNLKELLADLNAIVN